jgi:hypothetical protein
MDALGLNAIEAVEEKAIWTGNVFGVGMVVVIAVRLSW